MFGVDAVDPDYRVASVYLSVERPTARISNESTSLESEYVHEELLGGLHVLVDSQRNDGLGSHARATFPDLGRGDCTVSGLVSNEFWCHLLCSSSAAYNPAEPSTATIISRDIILSSIEANCSPRLRAGGDCSSAEEFLRPDPSQV